MQTTEHNQAGTKKNPIVAESKITDQETHADRELADYTSRGDEENKAGDGDQ